MLRKTTTRSPQCPTNDWSSTISQRKRPRRMSSAQRSASLRASICVRCSRLLARIAPIAVGDPTGNTKAAHTVSLSAWVRLLKIVSPPRAYDGASKRILQNGSKLGNRQKSALMLSFVARQSPKAADKFVRHRVWF